jgi:hypothetical protein
MSAAFACFRKSKIHAWEGNEQAGKRARLGSERMLLNGRIVCLEEVQVGN